MPTVDELRIVLDAETAKLTRRLSAADQFMRGFERATQQRLARIDGYFRTFMAGGAALAGGMGAGGLIEYANAWTRVERSISASSEIFGMPLHNAKELTQFANEARIGVEEFTKTYFRSAAAIRDLGLGAEVAAKMTSTLSMALKLGGATMSEQQSVLLQYSQALNKGKLDGDEFRSVMEAAPVVVELLSKRLKVGKGEIIKWAAEGKLKVKDLVGALTDGADQVQRIFKRMPQTVDESLAVLRNAVVQYVGERDKMIGGTEKLAALIGGTARNIDTVADSALVAGAALLGLFGPRMLTAVGRFALGAGAVTSPLGLIMALVAGGSAAMTLFGDRVGVAADGLVTLRDTSQAVIDVVSGRLAPIFDQASATWQTAVDKIRAALEGMPVSLADVAGAAKTAINTVIGLFSFAVRAIKVAFAELPSAIGEIFREMVNSALTKVEGLVRGMAELINKLLPADRQIDLNLINLDRLRFSEVRSGLSELNTLLMEETLLLERLAKLHAATGNGVRDNTDEHNRLAGELLTVRERILAVGEAQERIRMGGSPSASTRVREGFRDAGQELSRDFVGEFGAGLDGLHDEIKKRAKAIAETRYFHGMEEDIGKAMMAQGRNLRGTGKALPEPVDEKLQRQMARAYEQVMGLQRRAFEAAENFTAGIMEEHDKEWRKFQDLHKRKLITTTDFENARLNLAIVTAKKLGEAAEKEWARLRETTDILSKNMGDMFDKFTSRSKMSFRELLHSVLADIAKMAFRMAVLKPLFGDSSTPGNFGLVGNAMQSMMQGMGFGGFRAAGGPVSPDKAYIVGEQGRELFVPTAPGAIVPNHVLRNSAPAPGGSGADNISISMPITLNAPGADAAELARLRGEFHAFQRRVPGIVVSTVNDARSRRMIRD